MPYTFSFKTETTPPPNPKTRHLALRLQSPEQWFLVGTRNKYGANVGLYLKDTTPALVYTPATYAPQYDFWAYFIHPTAQGESSGAYVCLNTYDTALFTFTFMQFGAHVADGPFVTYLKRLLALPLAAEYFPDLTIHNNRIHQVLDNGSMSQLESSTSTLALKDYLNPDPADITDDSLNSSARIVHWARNEADNRRIQVDVGINLFRSNMPVYHNRYALDGFPAKVCQMVCDIRHQGRAKSTEIIAALDTGGDYDEAFDNLCQLGAPAHSPRINTVRTTSEQLESSGIFSKKYEASTNSFVPI